MRLVTAGLLAAALGLSACAESATSSAPNFSGTQDGSATASEAPTSTEVPTEASSPDPNSPAPTPAGPACSPQPADIGAEPEAVTFEGEAPADLQVDVLTEGEDPDALPQPGDCVQVHYIGRLFDTGEVFDSSYPRGATLALEVGAGMVIPGFEQGVAQTPLGATTRVTIPPDLGYGAAGAGPIPPDATLVFDIEVVEVASGGAAAE